MNERDIALVAEVDPLLGDTSSTLRQAKGTIILHITFAIKQDQDLGRAFLKYLKVWLKISGFHISENKFTDK